MIFPTGWAGPANERRFFQRVGPGWQMKGDFSNGSDRASKREMSSGRDSPGPEKSVRADLYSRPSSFHKWPKLIWSIFEQSWTACFLSAKDPESEPAREVILAFDEEPLDNACHVWSQLSCWRVASRVDEELDVLRKDRSAVNGIEWYAQTLDDALQTECALVWSPRCDWAIRHRNTHSLTVITWSGVLRWMQLDTSVRRTFLHPTITYISITVVQQLSISLKGDPISR